MSMSMSMSMNGSDPGHWRGVDGRANGSVLLGRDWRD